jgi:centrosomal protein CEP19
MSYPASIKMQKLGVRFQPPTVFLFYTDTLTNKLRRRTVTLDDFTKSTNITDYANELHNDKITKKRNLFRYVPLRRLERLLFVLKEGLTTNASKSDIEKKLRKFDELDVNEDLNKLDDDTLKHKKLIMSETFEKNHIDPTSKDFVYDVAVDFEPPTAEQPASEWDSGDEIEEDIKQEGDDDDDNDEEEQEGDEDNDDFK